MLGSSHISGNARMPLGKRFGLGSRRAAGLKEVTDGKDMQGM